jgi:uncharacterized membrane protein
LRDILLSPNAKPAYLRYNQPQEIFTLTSLRNLHRFLASQSFYPLALASALALAFFAWRVLYSQSLNYGNLVWNLALAWVPYGCSLFAAALIRRQTRRRWLIGLTCLAWLGFFPNAPYIVTDFYHLGWRPPVPMWYDIGLIAIFAFTGCFLGIASLKTLQDLVRRRLGGPVSWLFVLIVLGFSGLGIYLGRFGRYNSWDLLLHPRAVLTSIAEPLINPLDNLGFVGFTFMFTAILIVFYWMFTSVNRLDESPVPAQDSPPR